MDAGAPLATEKLDSRLRGNDDSEELRSSAQRFAGAASSASTSSASAASAKAHILATRSSLPVRIVRTRFTGPTTATELTAAEKAALFD